EGWAILLRQKQKKLIMLPSETMIWQPEFTDKTLSRKPGAVQLKEEDPRGCIFTGYPYSRVSTLTPIVVINECALSFKSIAGNVRLK
ncbi:hypothetical protein K1582_25100, partial [Salmonella enterica]